MTSFSVVRRRAALVALAVAAVLAAAVPAGGAVLVPEPAGASPTATAGPTWGRAADDCGLDMAIFCPGLVEFWAGGPSFLGVPASCALAGDDSPRGSFSIVPGTTGPVGEGRLLTYRVEIEDGLSIHPGCFADAVDSVLGDPRSWTANRRYSFARVDEGHADIRVLLASPRTVDRLCYPYITGRRLSCRMGNRAILNVWRWRNGADAYGADVVNYRRYLVNHEVGHVLGRGHRLCPGAGEPAPVMMQQTKGIGSCAPNPWPYPNA